jgi:UDP-N-acetylglucosamine 2-epimerase
MIQGNQRKDLLSIPEWLLGKLQDASQKLVLITGHRRESFGDGIQEICKAIRQLATAHPDVQFVYPVHLNPNVLKPVHAILGGMDNIALLEPLNYYSFAYLMSRAYIIISDSGGVQEEAPSLGVPVLVTRTVTERMEVVRNGTVRLVGCDSARIVSEAQELLSSATAYTAMTKGGNPYGDGKASYRILETLLNHSVE